MFIGSPLLVSEPLHFSKRRKQDGYKQQKARTYSALRQHQSHDMAECRRKTNAFRNDVLRPFKDQSGAWRNGTSFGLNDLEALLTVAHEARACIAAHVLKR